LRRQGRAEEALPLFRDLETRNGRNQNVLRGLVKCLKDLGQEEEAIHYTERLAAPSEGLPADLDIENLKAAMDEMDALTRQMADRMAPEWEKNIYQLSAREDEGLVSWEEEEEESLIFEALPDIAGETVPIIDAGGIDPIISINEERELVQITDEEEDIPPYNPEEDPPPRIETAAFGQGQPAPAMPAQAPPAAPPGSGYPPAGYPPPGAYPPPQPIPVNTTMKVDLGTIKVMHVPAPPQKRRPLPPVPPGTAPPPPRPAAPPPTNPEETGEKEREDLFAYLKNLTNYLPNREKEGFQESGMAARIESLRDRIQSRGGLEVLEKIRATPDDQGFTPVPRTEPVEITGEKVASTLNFINEMARNVPDREIQENIQQRIGRILEKLRKID
jgi:hypothetical protein